MSRLTSGKHFVHWSRTVYVLLVVGTWADPESFVRGGPTLTGFFLVDEGREDPSTTISWPSLARQQNSIKRRFAGVPMMAQY